jgi:hypothetical protein
MTGWRLDPDALRGRIAVFCVVYHKASSWYMQLPCCAFR